MARSARAFAHAPTLSTSEETAGAALSAVPMIGRAAPVNECPPRRSAASLALQAGDEIDNLRDVQRAYVGLEKLLVPHGAKDSEEVYPTRSELSALVRLVNDALLQRIEIVDATVQSARDAMEGGAQ